MTTKTPAYKKYAGKTIAEILAIDLEMMKADLKDLEDRLEALRADQPYDARAISQRNAIIGALSMQKEPLQNLVKNLEAEVEDAKKAEADAKKKP